MAVRTATRNKCLTAFSDLTFSLVRPEDFFLRIITPALRSSLELRAAIVRVTFTPPLPNPPPAPSQLLSRNRHSRPSQASKDTEARRALPPTPVGDLFFLKPTLY